LSNESRYRLILEIMHRNSLLASQFPINQLPADSECNPVFWSERLRTAEADIGRANRTGCRRYRAIAIQHDERGVLISEPAQS